MKSCADQFIDLCLKCDEYTKVGVKRHNRAVKELSALYHKIEADKNFAGELYDSLLDHHDERVRSTAAAHSLGMNVNISKAESVLRDIAANSSNPFSRFNAEMTLQTWKKRGYLCF